MQLDCYSDLDGHGYYLIKSWASRGANDADPFSGFIASWIAFNGWAMVVTQDENDAQIVADLCADATLAERFTDFGRPGSPLHEAACGFAALWPIFDMKAIRKKERHEAREVRPQGDRRRSDVTDHYMRAGISSFQPRCWRPDHHPGVCGAEPDWPHTLRVLYQVRCNLFHGSKSNDSEQDRTIVSSAREVLRMINRYVAGIAGA